jgi:DNA-binding CsgD family transcriptional regulator
VPHSLDEICSRIGQIDSFGDLWTLATGYFGNLGFGALAYLLFDGQRNGEAMAILDSGFPAEAITAYETLGYGRHDPTTRVVMATGQPNTPDRIAQGFKLSKEEEHHRSVIQSFGVGATLNLPLYGPHGLNACAVLGRPNHPALLDPVNWTSLHMVAQAIHLRGLSLQPQGSVRQHSLSGREVEILRWVAQGKSNGVIADILQISLGTVDTYLRRVFEKLDVTDRTSAAVKGVSMGLIRA